MGVHAFSALHPSVLLVYGCVAVVLVMTAQGVIALAIAFASMALANWLMNGWRRMLGSLSWQLVLILAMVAFNCIFSRNGATLLVEWGPLRITLESIEFGLRSGLMMVCMLQALIALGDTVSTDEAAEVFGSKFPVLGLMVSRSLYLVPAFRRRALQVQDVQSGCTAACAKRSMASRAAMITTLMAWALEDSLDAAKSMRARGWGSPASRTHCKRLQLKAFDGMLIGMLVLSGCAVLAGESACDAIGASAASMLHDAVLAAWSLYFLLPVMVLLKERVKWMR